MQGMYDYYFNVETGEGTCVPPEGIVPKTSWLAGEEIQVIFLHLPLPYCIYKLYCHLAPL